MVKAERSIYPDIAVFEAPRARHSSPGEPPSPGALSDPPLVLLVDPVEVREVFIEILALREGERIVTVIEVLSFTNKTAASEGRRLYLTEQKELLASDVHLVEIDLLRRGEHTAAVPRGDLLARRGHWDYLVNLHRGGTGGRFETWARTVHETLPRIPIPLAGNDPDVVLDLEEVFKRCYDEGGYARRIDYRRKPAVPLEPQDAAWAEELLEHRGRR